jgi:hypothetical protein
MTQKIYVINNNAMLIQESDWNLSVEVPRASPLGASLRLAPCIIMVNG